MVCDKGLRVSFCLFVHLHEAIRLPQCPLSTDVKFCFWISQFSSADPWACPYAGVTCVVYYDLILIVELGPLSLLTVFFFFRIVSAVLDHLDYKNIHFRVSL